MSNHQSTEQKIHFPLKQSVFSLLIVIGFVCILYFGSTILLPLTIGILSAILLNQPTKTFHKWGLPRWASISLSVIIMLFALLVISGVFTWQVDKIANDWNEIEQKGHASISSRFP